MTIAIDIAQRITGFSARSSPSLIASHDAALHSANETINRSPGLSSITRG